FERRFLTPPGRRKKVEFARALARAAAESKAAHPVRQASVWHAIFGSWTPALRFAGGLAALIVVGGASWLILQNATLRSRLATLETEGRESARRGEQLRRELEVERSRSAEVQPQTFQATTAPVASLVLLPGLTRAEGAQRRLELDSSTQLARIEIELEARDDY